jgi:hypothetical protein
LIRVVHRSCTGATRTTGTPLSKLSEKANLVLVPTGTNVTRDSPGSDAIYLTRRDTIFSKVLLQASVSSAGCSQYGTERIPGAPEIDFGNRLARFSDKS